jgi:hypothetical protein
MRGQKKAQRIVLDKSIAMQLSGCGRIARGVYFDY